MNLISALSRVSVAPVDGVERSVPFKAYAPAEYSVLGPRTEPAAPPPVDPLVSCLLVTKGERAVIKCAIECYLRQSYANRELVIVTHPEGLESVAEVVRAAGAPGASIHCVGREMTLGDCRNIAIARARGHIVMQWDDDDLYDPHRVAVAVALLAQSGAVAVMLSRVLVWWPSRRLAAISERRLWEGTMAVWREHAPVYPSLRREEDTLAVDFLSRTRTVATYDLPLLYAYTAHGRNTWDAKHFEGVIERSEYVFQGVEYDELVELLSARTPIRDYERNSAMGGEGGERRPQPDAAGLALTAAHAR